MGSCTIASKTRTQAPRLPFARIAETILGKKYELSLVFVSSRTSRTLNKKYRDKDKPANVLSFPLSRDAGEIFIDLHEARKQAPDYGETYRQFVGHLFIHGLFHLKGFSHGSKMESEEKKFRRRFGVL